MAYVWIQHPALFPRRVDISDDRCEDAILIEATVRSGFIPATCNG